jgi:hypothetical protein
MTLVITTLLSITREDTIEGLCPKQWSQTSSSRISQKFFCFRGNIATRALWPQAILVERSAEILQEIFFDLTTCKRTARALHCDYQKESKCIGRRTLSKAMTERKSENPPHLGAPSLSLTIFLSQHLVHARFRRQFRVGTKKNKKN